MAKRCIGIDIGRSHLRAVQVARTPEGFCLEKAIAAPTRRSTDSLPEIVRSWMSEHGFDHRAEVAVSLPQHAFFFADVEMDDAGLAKARAGDVTDLKDHFPIPPEDLLAQVCSVLRFAGSKDSALMAATSAALLQEELHWLGESKVRPVRVDTPVTAAHAAVLMNHPESARGMALILCAEEATLSLAVTHDGKILLVRNIPMLMCAEEGLAATARQMAEVIGQEIEITWKRLFDTVPDAGLRIFLIASHQTTELLGSALREKVTGCIIPVDPYAHVRRAADVRADFPVCIAEGLALRTLQSEEPDRINFLAPYGIRTEPRRKMKKELKVCGALAAAAIVVWVVGLFVQLSSLESQAARLKAQARELFQQAVPDETNIVDPAAQLRQRLDAFRQDSQWLTGFLPGRSAPLEILRALSERTPTRGSLRLRDILITGGSVRIMGSCDTFATFTEWQQSLETLPGLHIADAPRPMKDPESGQVQFTISLSATRDKTS